jgi:hypothetical protein
VLSNPSRSSRGGSSSSIGYATGNRVKAGKMSASPIPCRRAETVYLHPASRNTKLGGVGVILGTSNPHHRHRVGSLHGGRATAACGYPPWSN